MSSQAKREKEIKANFTSYADGLRRTASKIDEGVKRMLKINGKIICFSLFTVEKIN